MSEKDSVLLSLVDDISNKWKDIQLAISVQGEISIHIQPTSSEPETDYDIFVPTASVLQLTRSDKSDIVDTIVLTPKKVALILQVVGLLGKHSES